MDGTNGERGGPGPGPLPEALRRGDYGEDPAFRDAVKAWLHERWRRKAILLDYAAQERAP